MIQLSKHVDTSPRDEIYNQYVKFIEAVLTKNRDWMEKNLDEDFHLWLTPTGTTLNKKEYITSAISVPKVEIEMVDVQVLHSNGYATSHIIVRLFEDWGSGEGVPEDVAAVMKKSKTTEIKAFDTPRISLLNGAWRKTKDGWKIFQHVYVGPID